MLAGVAASGYLAWQAWQVRTEERLGLAGIALLSTAVVWAVWAGSSPPRLSVRGGQLEIRRSGGRQVFDLANRYTDIELLGTPGRRGWRVLIHRRGMSPVEIDSSMVDPVASPRCCATTDPTSDPAPPLTRPRPPTDRRALARRALRARRPSSGACRPARPRTPAAALDGARGGQVVGVAGHQHAVEPQLPRLTDGERERTRGMALTTPGRPHRVADVPPGLEQVSK